MNILLNLLPEDKKSHLKDRVRSRFVFSQMLMILFFYGLYVVMLAGSFFSLQHNETSFQGMSRQLESGGSRKELLQIEKKFQEVNREVEVVATLNRGHLHFTELLLKIDHALPLGITLTSLSTKDYAVSMAGKAADRNDAVILERNLNDEACFTSVNIPPSTWLSPKDISFQIDFSVKKECIKE